MRLSVRPPRHWRVAAAAPERQLDQRLRHCRLYERRDRLVAAEPSAHRRTAGVCRAHSYASHGCRWHAARRIHRGAKYVAARAACCTPQWTAGVGRRHLMPCSSFSTSERNDPQCLPTARQPQPPTTAQHCIVCVCRGVASCVSHAASCTLRCTLCKASTAVPAAADSPPLGRGTRNANTKAQCAEVRNPTRKL